MAVTLLDIACRNSWYDMGVGLLDIVVGVVVVVAVVVVVVAVVVASRSSSSSSGCRR